MKIDIEKALEDLRPCPKCGGTIRLYSTADPDRTKDGYNCFAKCKTCKEEYPMPEAKLKVYRGNRIYTQSIKKAIRIWNESG